MKVKQTAAAKDLDVFYKRLKSAGLKDGFITVLKHNLPGEKLKKVAAAWNL
jgi:hypothetical protein